MTATILSSNRITPPYGLNGGSPGKTGRNTLIRRDGNIRTLQGNDEVAVTAGDMIVIHTPGGGGYGAIDEER
jgi:5-oxoprolinase (ATP-hydrolysing)